MVILARHSEGTAQSWGLVSSVKMLDGGSWSKYPHCQEYSRWAFDSAVLSAQTNECWQLLKLNEFRVVHTAEVDGHGWGSGSHSEVVDMARYLSRQKKYDAMATCFLWCFELARLGIVGHPSRVFAKAMAAEVGFHGGYRKQAVGARKNLGVWEE